MVRLTGRKFLGHLGPIEIRLAEINLGKKALGKMVRDRTKLSIVGGSGRGAVGQGGMGSRDRRGNIGKVKPNWVLLRARFVFVR